MRAEHIEHRPESETPPAILFQTEVDSHMLDARGHRLRLDRARVGGAEIALQLIIKIHDQGLWAAAMLGKRGVGGTGCRFILSLRTLYPQPVPTRPESS